LESRAKAQWLLYQTRPFAHSVTPSV
jgi:hypothetical protein